MTGAISRPGRPPHRVLAILNSLQPSGVERMLSSAATHWQEYGIVHDILSTGETPGPFSETLSRNGYRIHHIPFARSPLFFWRVAWLLRSQRWDAVHIHCERASFWYALTVRIALPHAVIVRGIHNFFDFRGGLRLRRSWQRRIMRRLLGIVFIAPSANVARHEQATFANIPAVVPNWIDVRHHRQTTAEERRAARARLGLGDDQLCLVTVGNCSRAKNHTCLFQMLAEAPQARTWLLLHLGESESTAEEQRLCRRLGIGDRVWFMGQQDPLTAFQASDLYLMPSTHEGLGMAAVEALAHGLPCVLSGIPGFEIFANYEPAVLRCPDLSPIPLATSITTLMAQTRAAPSLLRQAADAVHRDFAPEQSVAVLAHLYKSPRIPSATSP